MNYIEFAIMTLQIDELIYNEQIYVPTPRDL